MRKALRFYSILASSVCIFGQGTQKTMYLYRFVTDFGNHVVDSARVIVMNDPFEPVAQAIMDSTGPCSLVVGKENYLALTAIRMNDYGKTRLEYPATCLHAKDSLDINPCYGRPEIHGVNAFSVQGSGSN